MNLTQVFILAKRLYRQKVSQERKHLSENCFVGNNRYATNAIKVKGQKGREYLQFITKNNKNYVYI